MTAERHKWCGEICAWAHGAIIETRSPQTNDHWAYAGKHPLWHDQGAEFRVARVSKDDLKLKSQQMRRKKRAARVKLTSVPATRAQTGLSYYLLCELVRDGEIKCLIGRVPTPTIYWRGDIDRDWLMDEATDDQIIRLSRSQYADQVETEMELRGLKR